jgi:hypothetical protein
VVKLLALLVSLTCVASLLRRSLFSEGAKAAWGMPKGSARFRRRNRGQRRITAMPPVAPWTLLGVPPEGWLTVIALILGPIIALRLQRRLDLQHEHDNRKRTVFKELMATRANILHPRHVEALNAIEIEFSGTDAADEAVTSAWRLYFDHLRDNAAASNPSTLAVWSSRKNELLVDLLYEMSQALGYGFDKATLKSGIYSPQAHIDLANDQAKLTQFLLELFEGKRAMSSVIYTNPDYPLLMRAAPAQAPVPAAPPPAAPIPAVANPAATQLDHAPNAAPAPEAPARQTPPPAEGHS